MAGDLSQPSADRSTSPPKDKSIAPSSFYAPPPQSPPSLPPRPKPGSSLTKTAFIPEPKVKTPPPNYGNTTSDIPILTTTDPVDMPDLIPNDPVANPWEVSQSDWGNPDPTWPEWPTYAPKVAVSNRIQEEEVGWWDPTIWVTAARPGPGSSPPVIVHRLHDSEHTLFSVTATVPILNEPGPSPNPGALNAASSPPPRPPSSASSEAPSVPPGLTIQPPTEEETRKSVPHPNAYYCRAEHGWVLLSWQSSTVLPPFSPHFSTSNTPLPDLTVRNATKSCLEGDPKKNYTHHFHFYEKAVDSAQLAVPFSKDEWRTRQEQDPKGEWLDMYICCQCQVYVLASQTIPGVINKRDLNEWVKDRSNPPVGQTTENAVVDAFATLIKAVQNNLWKAERRRLRTSRPRFVNSVGSHPSFFRILTALGFEKDSLEDGEHAWKMPNTNPGTLSRRKMLRAWVELCSWIYDYTRRHDRTGEFRKKYPLAVKMINVREDYQMAMGAHADQLPRQSSFWHIDPKIYEVLGLTKETYTPELTTFCYLAQCRCDPTRTVEYFSALFSIVDAMGVNAPEDLQRLVFEERERGRFTQADIQESARVLGFGENGPLGIEYDPDVGEEFIEGAWRECTKRAWRDLTRCNELQKAANDALRIIAESRASKPLHDLWKSSNTNLMTPEKAFAALDVPSDVEDYMLMMVYATRLQDSPYQKDRYKEALLVIAEYRESERLKKFAVTGEDPGEGYAEVGMEVPRGLNQLGNTCYLNSILQYFYTIKELRDTVLKLQSSDPKAIEDIKLSEKDLKKYRVGGRLVTQKEVVRSRKFVNQLAHLFFNLEYCEQPAVTPTLELAKLALVTSKDEDEDEVERGGTDTSNDTDATLVDDDPQPHLTATENPTRSPARSPGSILGKRPRDVGKEPSAMNVDEPAGEPSSSQSSRRDTPSSTVIACPTPRRPEQMGTIVVDLEKNEPALSDSPPPLETPEPRPAQPARKPTMESSGMMFGKQHDVAECLDNCMFQIETALLEFEGETEAQASEKTTIVKRLFYGKMRQRLSPFDTELKQGSVHEKEDLFSHLPVNVMEDGVDIYDGLSRYFDDVVEFQGTKARMEMSLVDLPPLLQVQLQRVQFNRETLQPYKSQAYIKFGETLFMDRFLDGVDPKKKNTSKRLQRELRSCRERISELQAGRGVPFVQALKNTSKFLEQLGEMEQHVITSVADETQLVTSTILELQKRSEALKKELEELWSTDEPQAIYELTSVFIHRGSSPTFGHYFFYSRNLPDHPDAWFKYNDSQVTAVSKDEVLADTTGSTANPYLLVFARKGSQAVQTVKRFDPNNLEQTDAMEV